MLLTIIVWLYITLISLTWGHLFVRLISKNRSLQATPQLPWPILCLIGLAILGTLSYWLSIFLPLGLAAHLIIIIPVIIFHLSPVRVKNLYGRLFMVQKDAYAYLFLLIAAVLMVLIISSYKIIHPDTLQYHAQIIKWMEEYKAIPGIVNVNMRLGLQSWWFSVHAIFRFSFIGPNNFIFVNGCVACWFLVFVIGRIQQALYLLKQRDKASVNLFLAWMGLLVFCLVSWTQVRLTAASASPDFIAAIYIWGAFYLFFQAKKHIDDSFHLTLTILFGCAAIALKFSAIVIILLPVFICFRLIIQKRHLSIPGLIALAVVIVLPGIIRNVINSGYPLYPSTALNILHSDWKPGIAEMSGLQDYITAYARFPVKDYEESRMVFQLPITEWVPVWWSHLSLADKSLLAIIFILLIWYMATIKKQLKINTSTETVILLIALSGSLLWFFKAPAPRFGTSFLIPLACCLLAGFYRSLKFTIPIKATWCQATMVFTGILLMAYTAHRATNFYAPKQLLAPLGVEQSTYQKVPYQGVPTYLHLSSIGYGFSPVPSVHSFPPDFILRGNDITDGFKKK